MKAILTILCIGLVATMAQAQSFGGGAGDGHAMAELVLRETGVPELEQAVQVYPTVLTAGQTVFVKHNLPGSVQGTLYALDGTALTTDGIPANGQLATQQLLPGLYLLQVQYQGTTAVFKITIAE